MTELFTTNDIEQALNTWLEQQTQLTNVQAKIGDESRVFFSHPFKLGEFATSPNDALTAINFGILWEGGDSYKAMAFSCAERLLNIKFAQFFDQYLKVENVTKYPFVVNSIYIVINKTVETYLIKIMHEIAKSRSIPALKLGFPLTPVPELTPSQTKDLLKQLEHKLVPMFFESNIEIDANETLLSKISSAKTVSEFIATIVKNCIKPHL